MIYNILNSFLVKTVTLSLFPSPTVQKLVIQHPGYQAFKIRLIAFTVRSVRREKDLEFSSEKRKISYLNYTTEK